MRLRVICVTFVLVLRVCVRVCVVSSPCVCVCQLLSAIRLIWRDWTEDGRWGASSAGSRAEVNWYRCCISPPPTPPPPPLFSMFSVLSSCICVYHDDSQLTTNHANIANMKLCVPAIRARLKLCDRIVPWKKLKKIKPIFPEPPNKSGPLSCMWLHNRFWSGQRSVLN